MATESHTLRPNASYVAVRAIMNDFDLRTIVRAIAKAGVFGHVGSGNTRQGRRITAALKRGRNAGLLCYDGGCWGKAPHFNANWSSYIDLKRAGVKHLD